MHMQLDRSTDWKLVIHFILTTGADVFSRDWDCSRVMTIGYERTGPYDVRFTDFAEPYMYV